MANFFDQFDAADAPSSSRPKITVTPMQRAFLNSMASGESPDYQTMYGGGRFEELNDHPRQNIPIRSGPNAGKTSSAAGRYQFLQDTWDEARTTLGLPDFSPESQDAAATWLAERDYAKRTKGRNLWDDLESAKGDPAKLNFIGGALNRTWTSLPGGAEPNRATNGFGQRMASELSAQSRQNPAGNFFDQFDQGKPESANPETVAREKLAGGLSAGKTNESEVLKSAAFRSNQGVPAANATDAAVSGVTMGWSDEAVAAATALIDMVMRGEGYEEARSHNLAAIRDRLDQYKQENPNSALAAELAGSMTAGPAAGTKLAASLLGRMAQGGKYGGLTGGITGAGNAEEDRLTQSWKGAAVGAGVGAGIPLAVGAVRAAASPFTKTVSAAVNPEGRAVNQLQRDMARDGVTPAAARQQLDDAAAAGAPMTLGDIGGRNVMGLGRAVASGKGAGSERYNAFLEARRLEAPERVMENVKTALGDADAFYPTVERIIANRKAIAEPLYEAAYAKAAPDTPLIRSILSTPAGQSAVRNAERLSANEGIQFAQNVRGLDLVKRSFDDMIDAAKRAGGANDARVLTGMKDRLVKEIDRKVPEYRTARQAFSSESQIKDALERGRELLRPGNSPEQIVKELHAMSSAEREAARLGMARQLRDVFDNPSHTTSNLAKLIYSNRSKQIIDALFPNQTAAQQFRANMIREHAMLKRGQQVQGGSNTVNKGIEGEDAGLLEAGVDIIRRPVGGTIDAVLSGGRRLAKGVNEKTANVLGDILSSTDPARQRQILQQIEQMLPDGAIERLLTIAGPREAAQLK